MKYPRLPTASMSVSKSLMANTAKHKIRVFQPDAILAFLHARLPVTEKTDLQEW
jgi:hypothetical protein